jgi:hypothetical protein
MSTLRFPIAFVPLLMVLPCCSASHDRANANGATSSDAATDSTDLGEDASTSDASAEAADAAAAFLGTWTLTGTVQSRCPGVANTYGPVSVPVTFSLGSGTSPLGSIDLLFDAGMGCSLAMFIDDGVARLVTAPQACNAGAALIRSVTSVTVAPANNGFSFGETQTTVTGCQYYWAGTLTR